MKQPAPASYATLRDKVQQTLILGRQKIEEAKVLTYYETGRLINQYLGKIPGERQERHRQVVARLARDLGFGEKVFYRCMRFAECFPQFSARRNMTWAHYRALIGVPDEKKRLALMDEASKGEWSSRELEIEIRNFRWEKRVETLDGKASSLLEVPEIGPFYTYEIIQRESIHPSLPSRFLDRGFSFKKDMSLFPSCRQSAGAIVTSVRNSHGNYTLKTVLLPGHVPGGEGKGAEDCDAGSRLSSGILLYNYKAFVEKVIDGDTLKVEFDIGFGDWHGETIRLRGIDCPEMNTPEGRRAKAFVEARLEDCEFIVLKSTKAPRKEKWGRYLGDVFLPARSPAADSLVYLNNLLLEKGHAVRVRS